MRIRDLGGIAILLSLGLVFSAKYLLPIFGIEIPFIVHLGSPLIASFVLSPIVLLLLTPLNNRLREWRKAHGRDIEEEEKYETDHGMIKLTPNQDVHEDNNGISFRH